MSPTPASSPPERGVERIRAAFAAALTQGRAAFMPYQMLGHPTLEMSPQVIEALAAAGADLFELGMPFSDPLADGAVIQAAGQVALDQGITVDRCLSLVAALRSAIPDRAFCLMGYINPILAHGAERFVREAAEAGVDGLIVPDLPPDEPEAEELAALCARYGIAPIYLLAPTSTAERIELAVARSQRLCLPGQRDRHHRRTNDLGSRPERLRAAGTCRSGAPAAWTNAPIWPSASASAALSCPHRSRRSPTASSSAVHSSGWQAAAPIPCATWRLWARRWRRRQRGPCHHDRTMNAPSTDFTSRREQEGRRIYRALFRRDIPSILLERYLIAAERMDAELGAQELDAYYRAVEAQDDLEALEFAARLTGRLPLLRRKFQAMVYLAETLPDHQVFFVNRRSNWLGGIVTLASSAFESVVQGIKGLLALRRLPHG